MSTNENSELVERSATGDGAEDSGTLPIVSSPNGTQDPAAPLPTLPTIGRPGSWVPTVEPTLGQLGEMIAAQRQQLARTRPCAGTECTEVVAAERTLQLLLEEFRRRTLEVG